MLLHEVVAVRYEHYAELRSILWVQNGEDCNVTAGGKHSNHRVLRFNFILTRISPDVSDCLLHLES
jgi:hypothetical protein